MPQPDLRKLRISARTKWGPLVGYSRLVKVGNVIHVSGTTAVDAEGEVVGVGDPYAQTRQALENIRTALEAAGARLENIVRTRIYVTDITKWEAIGKAHGEAFRSIRPASTMVEVKRLVDSRMLVEIEADAITE